MGKFIPKITIWAILWVVSPHFSCHNGDIRRDGADLGHFPHAKFCKNRLREYTPLGENLYQKLPIFGAVSPYL